MSTHQEPTFGDLIVEMWNGKFFILLGLCLGCLCAAAFASFAVPHYEARMVLAPANPMAMGSSEQEAQSFKVVQAQTEQQFLKFESVMKGASVAKLLLRDDAIRAGLAFARSRQAYYRMISSASKGAAK